MTAPGVAWAMALLAMVDGVKATPPAKPEGPRHDKLWPHIDGTAYGCPACEATCFCAAVRRSYGDDVTCIYCEENGGVQAQ